MADNKGTVLPNLPGYSVRAAPANGYFPKKQTLHYMVGYKQERGQEPILCAEEPKAAVDTIKASRAYDAFPSQKGTMATLPQWIENDRKVLRFYGYFQEHVTEDPTANMRVRKVVFLYYLEDDTLQISEPKQDNSGLPQVLSYLYFCLGESVPVYGITYLITDADGFTRNWLRDNHGRELGAPVATPDDPSATLKASRSRNKATLGPPSPRTDDLARFNEARLGKPSNVLDSDSLRQFLKNDGKVLRFWAMWDERGALYGDRRPYVVHYYLADDTMEVLEVHEMNSGRDPFPVFIARAPMPKAFTQPGFTVAKRADKRQCYTPADLRIGAVLDLHNRNMLLYMCDAFTKRWYMDNLGYTDEELCPMDIREEVPILPKPAMAPYNGYGTLLDSEQNCRSLVPKPPKKDLRKLVNKDGMILRFVCKFQSRPEIGFEVQPSDEDRQFVLSYFMNDDTISVFEPPIRNSGMIGGKFLERGIKYKQGTEERYSYKDLYVGAEIIINNFNFMLANADEYTFSYMENNKHLFIMGDGHAVLTLLKAQVAGKEEALRTAFIEIDADGSGQLDAEELSECLQICGFRITKHQVTALARLLDTDRSGAIDIKEFLTALEVSPDKA